MLQLTLKNLAASKVRFALTTFGVMLAVSFVVSAFVLGDGLRSTFSDLSEEITAGVDLEVRPASEFGDVGPLPVELAEQLAEIDGIAAAVASYEAPMNSVLPQLADGSTIALNGPPQLAFSYSDNEALSPFVLVEGASPQIGEFVIDPDSAADHGFELGSTYTFTTPQGIVELTLSGLSSFGADNATVGATLMQMNAEQAPALFGQSGPGAVAIELAPGADSDSVAGAVQAVLGNTQAEVIDNATLAAESKAEFTEGIDIVGNILLGFGGVSLFVSIFIIYNTFAIVLSQRTRELALLRTIGADGRQITTSVLGEALLVGLIASGAGIAGGIGVAKGLEALFGLIGADLPDSPTIIATRTIVAALVIGVGVTLLAAIGPARKASTVPAIAALRGDTRSGSTSHAARIGAGTVLAAAGIVAGTVGLTGIGSTTTTVTLMALGAMAVFLGVTLLSPLAVDPVTRVLGWPLRRTAGVAGHLAQQNAARNPYRTATTAAALMIGLALVSTAMVVGQSVKSSFGSTLSESTRFDYVISDQLEEVEFDTGVVDALQADPAFDAVTGFRYVEARIDGEITELVAADLAAMPELLDIDVQSGGFDTEAVNPVLVSADQAADNVLEVGAEITTEFANGTVIDATVVGIYHDQAIIDVDYLFASAAIDAVGIPGGDEWLAVSVAGNASQADVDAAFAQITSVLPETDIETAGEFQQRLEGAIDQVLTTVNVMVALAVIIALIGIANTLALSVFERTRELGLVRAVGMTRRQLRRMVRFEAALVATFGAVLGVGVGVLFGWGVVNALPDAFASSLTIPVQPIATLVAVAASAGVLAAVLPARRAGKLNVLEAIAHS